MDKKQDSKSFNYEKKYIIDELKRDEFYESVFSENDRDSNGVESAKGVKQNLNKEQLKEQQNANPSQRSQDLDNIKKEEALNVIMKLRPSVFNFTKALIMGVVFLFLALINIIQFSNYNFLMFVISFSFFLFVYIARLFTVYVITEKRIEKIWGVITKSSREVKIGDVKAINVRGAGLLGLIKIGSVDIFTAGSSGAEVSFERIWFPEKVKKILRSLQDKN